MAILPVLESCLHHKSTYFFFEMGSYYVVLVGFELCSPGWHSMCGTLLASVSLVLGLQACAPMPDHDYMYVCLCMTPSHVSLIFPAWAIWKMIIVHKFPGKWTMGDSLVQGSACPTIFVQVPRTSFWQCRRVYKSDSHAASSWWLWINTQRLTCVIWYPWGVHTNIHISLGLLLSAEVSDCEPFRAFSDNSPTQHAYHSFATSGVEGPGNCWLD